MAAGPSRSPGELLLTDVLLRGGDAHVDVRVVDGRIAEVGPGLVAAAGATTVVGDRCPVLPGLVEPHLHLAARPGTDDLLVEALRRGVDVIHTALLDRAPRRLVISGGRVVASTRTDTTLHVPRSPSSMGT